MASNPMPDEDKLSIALACITLDTLDHDIRVAEERCHEQTMILRSYELEFWRVHEKCENVARSLDSAVNRAVTLCAGDVNTHGRHQAGVAWSAPFGMPHICQNTLSTH